MILGAADVPDGAKGVDAVTIDGDVIELERATAEERRDLLEAYIRRHSGE
ncbi:hypothetical protein AB0L44_05415 [Nonomuraea wenchangensis]